MKKYILAIDQGTTSSRAILFNQQGGVVDTRQMSVTMYSSQSGWAEQNANEIWETVYGVITELVNTSHIELSEIAAIGVTNQRETTILWDRITGEPVYHAIVWQSRQSQEICERWIQDSFQETIQEKTGLIINPYFSASKIKWIFEHVPGVYEKAKKGDILFGTIDTFLVWKLTNGKQFITDTSNASRTMMFNIHTLQWDDELLELYGIPKVMLPQIVESSGVYGICEKLWELDPAVHIPIASMIGDQQAALFGQCCYQVGDVKNTYGTGCFMLMNTKDKIVRSKSGLLSTVAWTLNGKTEYALEGSVFVAGEAVRWMRDKMRMFAHSKDVELYSDRYRGSDGVYVVPAFVGLGTPYWDNDARGAVFGLTLGTKKEHLINATVESIAYQSKDVMEVMKKEAGVSIRNLAVDGGASCNNYLMQFQADILDCKITRPECLESTALGAAYLAGLATKFWKDTQEIVKMRRIEQIFMSNMKEERREELYRGWKKAIEATRVFKV